MGEARRVYANKNGIRRTSIVDPDNPDRLVVKTEQVLDEVLDGIARDRETMRHGVNKVAARLPLFVYEDLVHRGIADDEDAFKKWLNGPEAAPWRIWQGTL